MSEELIADVTDADGSSILRVDDVTTVAIELSDVLDAELLEGAEGFVTAVEDRHSGLAERVAAHAALELMARAAATEPAEPQVVTDVDGLRSLVQRIEAADRLVDASSDDARARAGAASGLAVHPTSIRDAADDVVDARSVVAERQAEVDRLHAEAEPAVEPSDTEPSNTPPDAPAPADPEPRSFSGWKITDRDEMRRAALVVVASLVVGILVLVLTGSPLALAIPGVAVCWAVVLVIRQRDSAYDEEIASRNLANVSMLTDRAYGGAGLIPDVPQPRPEVVEAERALADANDRLAYAESSWRSLVGPDADDVEAVVRARDAQYGVTDAVIAELPSVRAAAAYGRRLRAQWKLAWWVLDRPVPAAGDEAEALEALEADGVTEITVALRSSGLTAAEQERLDDLAQGRSEEALAEVADRTFPAVVVADSEGEITDDEFRERTAQLPDDVRVVVVAPAS